MKNLLKIIIVLVLFVLGVYIMNSKTDRYYRNKNQKYFSTEFKGVIVDIKFTDKKEVLVFIDKKTYYPLNYIDVRKNNNWFRVGDSIAKDVNGVEVEQYKIKDGRYHLYAIYDILEQFQYSE